MLSIDGLPIWGHASLFIVAGALVWILGVRLTRVLDVWAARTGVGRALVGMLLLGGVTSLPELANVVGASTAGEPALAINNLLGSAAINVFLLAAVDAVVGRNALTAVQARPGTLMMCALCVLVLTLTAALIVMGDVDVFGVGAGASFISGISVAFFLMASSYDRRAPWTVKGGGEAAAKPSDAAAGRSTAGLGFEILALAAAIFVFGYTLSITGEAIASATGWGTGVVGFLLIGLATSLPELSTIVTALRLKQYEMAFGQVLGTNFVNLALVAVADVGFSGEPVLNTLGRFEILLALLGALLTGIFLVGLLERRDPKIMRVGYDSVAVILLFIATAAYLVIVRPN